MLEKQVELFHAVEEDENSEIGTSSNIIPQTLSLNYDMLSKFRLFKWMYQNENIRCKHFDELNIPQNMVDKQKEYARMVSRIHYISNINFEATYSYLETSSTQLSLIRIYSINSITTQDPEMFRGLKEWIQSLKKFSTLISESGEMQRIQFFKQQREIISTL